MCDRHVAHLIAEYEAARLDGDEEGEDEGGSSDSAHPSTERTGLLSTVRARLAR